MYPRKDTNGQVIVLTSVGSESYVLIQVRSPNMPVMPGFFGVPGGMYSKSDVNSKHTALRETFEETGINLLQLSHFPMPQSYNPRSNAATAEILDQYFVKFAEGGKCDWYVCDLGVIHESLVCHGQKTYEIGQPKDAHELGDADYWKAKLPWKSDSNLIDVPGHIWVPLTGVTTLRSYNDCLHGLERRFEQGVAMISRTMADYPIESNL